jgi:hypothetical protein
VAGDRKAGATLDLGHGLVDQAPRHLGYLTAARADDVFVVAAGALEPGSAVTEFDALQVAALGEMHESAKDRRRIGVHALGTERRVGLVEGPAVTIGAGDEFGYRVPDVAWASHARTIQGYANGLQYARPGPVHRSTDTNLADWGTDSGDAGDYRRQSMNRSPNRPRRIAAAIGFLTLVLLALPSAAGAAAAVHVEEGEQTYTVIVQGHPRASDLRAIQAANYAPPARGGARASSSRTFCNRSVLSNQSCGNVPTEFSDSNAASYGGRGTVRVCALMSRGSTAYPNGDPHYPWIGKCSNNSAYIATPGWMYTYPNDGAWINNAVVNASPWTHTIKQTIDFLPFSTAGVCWFEVQC